MLTPLVDAMPTGEIDIYIRSTAKSKIEKGEAAVGSLRVHAMLHIERACFNVSRQWEAQITALGMADSIKPFAIIGVDEVGVGSLAGPLVSCAVALDVVNLGSSIKECVAFTGLRDSKKLSPARRELIAPVIMKRCLAYAIASLPAQEVDRMNVENASKEAMRRAVMALITGPLTDYRVHVLVDAHTKPNLPADVTQSSFPKADDRSLSVAAASVVAKVARDTHMDSLHKIYPQFGFNKNAGYGSDAHLKVLLTGMISPEHRRLCRPVRKACELYSKLKSGLCSGRTSKTKSSIHQEKTQIKLGGKTTWFSKCLDPKQGQSESPKEDQTCCDCQNIHLYSDRKPKVATHDADEPSASSSPATLIGPRDIHAEGNSSRAVVSEKAAVAEPWFDVPLHKSQRIASLLRLSADKMLNSASDSSKTAHGSYLSPSFTN